jgi:hypothetical protein
VDGDHGSEAVETDIRNVLRKLKPSGILIGHDIDWPSVRSVVERLLPGFGTGPDNVWYIRVADVRKDLVLEDAPGMHYVTKKEVNLHGQRILLVAQPQTPPVTSVVTPIPVLDLAAYYRKYAQAKVTCAKMTDLPEGQFDYVGYSVLEENDAIEGQINELAKKYPSARILVGGKWATDPGNPVEGSAACFYRGSGELLVSSEIDFKDYPNWDAKDLVVFSHKQVCVTTTRGCPYKCHFCHNTERKVSRFSPERTVQNVKLAFERAGAKSVYFVDDIFTSSARRMRVLLDSFERVGFDIRGKSRFLTHVNFVRDDVLDMIQAYAPWCVEIGIESGSTEQLRRMGKDFTAEKAYEATEKLLARGLPLSVLILIGFPGETLETLEETRRFVDHFRARVKYIHVSYYQPVRNTVGWDMAAERLGHEPVVGGRAHKVCYVDPNLTAEILQDYHDVITGRSNVLSVHKVRATDTH